MALSYINNKEIKFGSSKPLNGVYTPGSPTREYEPLDSLGIYLNSGIPLSYGVENNRYMSMSDEFAATSQGNSYSFNQLFAAQMMLGFKLHDRFIACDTEHKIIGTEPLLHKAYLAEITEKTLDYFKIKIYGDKTRTYCIRMSSSEVPTSYVDLTNSFDENGLNLTQTDRQSFLSYYRFYPLTVRALSTRVVETLGKGCYFLPSSESLGELSGDILSKFNAFISSDGNTLTSLGDIAFAYMGDVAYAVNYGGKITESLLDTKVNYSDALTYEQITATTDLTNKVAGAGSVKTLKDNISNQINNIAVIPPYSFSDLGSDTTDEDYLKKWLNKVWTDHHDAIGCPIIAKVTPNSQGIVIGHIYPMTTLQYAGFMMIKDNSNIVLFGYSDTDKWYYLKK